MSAFILENSSFNNIRNKLIENDQSGQSLCTLEEANKVVKSFYRMNHYAVTCRCGESGKKSLKFGEVLNNITKHAISDVQMYKTIQCLHYQCCEGDTETKCRKAWKLMEKLIIKFAQRVAATHPAYALAKWG